MGSSSTIEWTDATWNPVTGCDKVSPGCEHCYAERFSARLQAMGHPRYVNGTGVTLHWDLLDTPLHWAKPRLVFVNSMSDLFHEQVSSVFIARVFETAANARKHTFQVLTKRSERLRRLCSHLPWPENVWAGVSVENADFTWRIADLRQVPAAVRFISFEPLLGPIPAVSLEGIHWVIVGGESGPRARPMDPEWARSLRDRCRVAGIPFFFKQWGGPRRLASGRVLDGEVWDQMPPGQHGRGVDYVLR